MLITVYGKPASGKSTLITNLACKLAENNYKVGLFSTDFRYVSLQLYYAFQDSMNGKPFGYLFEKEDFNNLDKYFIQTGDYKNIYIAGPRLDQPVLMNYVQNPDSVKKFLKRVTNMFDYVIAENTVDLNNLLSVTSITCADLLINTIYPDIQGISYSLTYESLVECMEPKAEIIRVASKVEDYMDLNTVSELLDYEFDHVFCYNKQISKFMSAGIPDCYNLIGKQNKSFIREINNLYKKITGEQKINEEL